MFRVNCPAQSHPAMCVCPFRTQLIHQGAVSFYTDSSTLRVGSRLYASPAPLRGAHIVSELMRKACRNDFAPARSRGFRGFEVSLYMAGRSGIQFEVLLPFVPATSQVRILQRAIRRFLRDRHALQAHALALSTHARLGEASPLALLPLELLFERFC
jgi:hypothetical protein